MNTDQESQSETQSRGIEFPLAKEALYSTRVFNERVVRSRRQPHGISSGIGPIDWDDPDACWENAGERADIVDPGAERALARFRQYIGATALPGDEEVLARPTMSEEEIRHKLREQRERTQNEQHGKEALMRLRKYLSEPYPTLRGLPG